MLGVVEMARAEIVGLVRGRAEIPLTNRLILGRESEKCRDKRLARAGRVFKEER